jgi:hypothetical protein
VLRLSSHNPFKAAIMRDDGNDGADLSFTI